MGSKRREQILEEVPILEILHNYGYKVHPEIHKEQQFSCDLHGDGHDTKPSARVYPDTNSFYCFACDKARNAIDITQIKENLNYYQALRFLEKLYRLPQIFEDEEKPVYTAARVETAYAPLIKRLGALLQNRVSERAEREQTLKALELYDKVQYLVKENQLTEEKAVLTLQKLLEEITG